MAINLNKGVNVHKIGDTNDVLSTSTPTDVGSQGILKETDASGVFVISNADLEVWFHYDDGNGTLQWVLHNTLSKADIGYQDGHAVAWRNHKDHGSVTAMYLKATSSGTNGEDPQARTMSISKVIIADADIKDSELKKDFLNWYSNPIAEDLPGQNAATQAVNYDGYERKYHDLSSNSIGDTYSFTVPGYVDSAITFTRMVDKIPCSYVYDDKSDETTISFEIIDGEYGDYHTTLDTWHTWWSLGEPPLLPFKMTIEVPEASGLGTQLQSSVFTAIMTYVTMNANQVGNTFRLMTTGIDLGSVGDQLIFVSPHGTIYGTMTAETADETTFLIDSMEVTPSQFPKFETSFAIYALPVVSFDFPLVMKSGETFDFAVNWGDGTEESLTESNFSTYAHGFSGSQTAGAADANAMTYQGYDTDVLTYSHTYTVSGSYQITITGNNIPLRYGHALEMTPADMVTRTSYDDFIAAQTTHSDPAPRAKAYIRSVDQWGSATFTDLDAAFERCINFDVLAFDIPKFGEDADLSRMFKLCANLSDANGSIERWDTSNVTSMQQLFAGVLNFQANIDTKLISDLSGVDYLAWNVGNVDNFSHMFVGLVNMNLRAGFNQPIPNWDMNSAQNMAGMFAYCNFNQDLLVKGMRSNSTAGAIIRQNVQVYDDNSVYFNGTNNTITTDNGGNIELDGSNGIAELLGEVGTTVVLASNHGNIKAVIAATGNVIELVIRSYDISVSTNEEAEFFNVHKPEFGSQPDWTAWFFGKNLASNETASLVKMFYNNIVFNSDISNWYLFTGTQGKVWLNEMFSYATNFNQPLPRTYGDTDDGPYMTWDAARAAGSTRMFKSAAKFNQDIGDMFMNASSNLDYSYMFHNATDYNNGGQSLNWDVTGSPYLVSMFENASSFNINISNWDVSNVTHFNNMFEDAVAFNQDFGQGPAGAGPNCWDTSNGERFDNMFQQCTSFNQPLFFDVRKAYSMSFFLDGASLYSQPLYITFGNGGSYVAGQSIGPQNIGKDPTGGKYLSYFMRGTNYGTAEVDALLVKLVAELQNLNTATHATGAGGHNYHNASDGNQYEGLLETLAAHTANSSASTARFGLIQNGWWVEDNAIVTPIPNNESFDIQGWSNDFEFPESTLIDAQVGGTFTLVDNDGNFSGTDFTLDYEALTNINGDAKDKTNFELISQYGGTAFAIKLKKGHVYTYNSSWDNYYIIHFKISTPNGSFRNVTRKIRLTNVKPDGVNILNMIDLGFPGRNTNLLTSASTTTLTYTGSWNTTPYGILKPKWPGSGAGIYGTYGGQYLGAAITVEGMPHYKDDFVTQLGLGNGAFDPTNLPPTWPNVVAGPYVHIKRNNFNSENDYEQFNTSSNPYKMYLADITEWINGAADQDGIDTREGVEVELVGVDMDLGWWVQQGPSGDNNGGSTQANYFCEFRSSPLPAQARTEIQGGPDDYGLFGFLDPSFDGFSNRKYGEAHPSDAHNGSDFNGTWHNINKRGWKNVTNKFEILKNYHTNPITGENQDHWEVTYTGEDIDSFPSNKHFPDNFQQTQSENDFWGHSAFSSSGHPQNSYPFYVPRIYQTEFGDTVTGNYWRKGVQFTIWYRFRDASNSTLMFGSDHGVGNETDDNGLYSGTLKKICLVVRTGLK